MPGPELVGETLPFTSPAPADGQVERELVVTRSGSVEGLAPGATVGDWRIDGKIGQGGMGSVHAATHPVIGKRAAIKVVHAELCRAPGTSERFVQEARVVNQVCHPNIVDIFDIGQLPDGRPYLVMELLRGRTLGERLEEGRLSPLEAIELLLQIADAVEAAHAHGVVHRDLKPDNIYLTEGVGGRTVVKVVDWGIAKLRETTAETMSLTTSGVMLGTPQYASPEQARGKSLDERTDIYSLGVIAYEMFLEAPPFVAENVADMVVLHLREPPPPPSDVWPDIPPALERLLLGMLAKRAADRPAMPEIIATLREVRTELEQRVAEASLRLSGRRLASGSMPPPTSGEPSLISRLPLSSFLPAARVETTPPRPLPGTTPRAPTGGTPALAVIPAGSGPHASPTPTPTPAPALPPGPSWPLWAAVFVGSGLIVAGMVAMLMRPTDHRVVPGTEPAAIVATTAVDPAPAAPVVPSPAPPVEVAPVPGLRLEVRGVPTDARVYVDDERVAPDGGRWVRDVPPGTHEVRVEASGREPYRRTIDVQEATVLQVELRRAGARRDRGRAPGPAPTPTPTPAIDPNATIEPF